MKRFSSLMSERGEARAVLASVLSIVLVIGLLQVAATFFAGGRAFGQSQPSPSSGFTIQFLNPSAGTSRELSTKNDGTDSRYHLVAWVNNVPADALVEFKYQATGSSTTVDLGPGTQVGPDTYELYSDLSGVGPEADNPAPTGDPGNSGTLRALLYSGSTEVARDEETVRVNQQAPPACPSVENPPPCFDESQANTVEMTYPTNAGALGYYRPNPGNGPMNSVFDVTFSTGSQSTTNITSYYTLSVPGTEPQWKACQSGSSAANETIAQAADGVRCEYASADNPAAVTAVAVRANDQTERLANNAADPDAADAHRIGTYEQDAATVTVNPQSTTQNSSGTAFPCGPVTTATVLDQVGRKIADVNMDVAAVGPSDNLFFDDSDSSNNSTSASKAPENHTTEGSSDCEGTPTPGNGATSQGEHEVPGEGDIKHIESTTDSDDAGSFRFRLFSNVGGETQFTVWADEDSNDRLCSAEAQSDGSIGWGQGAPAATGVADEDTSCPRPGPTGSTSPSSASPSSSSPRPSGTATGTSPSQQSRTITLVTSKARVNLGASVTLAGQIFASDSDCEDDEFVRISRRIHGQPNTTELTTARTDSEGRYSLEISPRKGAEYQALSSSHDDCGDAESSPVNVEVKVKITIKASDSSVDRGDRVRLTVKVRPKHAGTTVTLQSKAPGRSFKTVQKGKLNRKGVIIFSIEADWPKRTFRARWKSQHADHEGNTSRAITVRSKR